MITSPRNWKPTRSEMVLPFQRSKAKLHLHIVGGLRSSHIPVRSHLLLIKFRSFLPDARNKTPSTMQRTLAPEDRHTRPASADNPNSVAVVARLRVSALHHSAARIVRLERFRAASTMEAAG